MKIRTLTKLISLMLALLMVAAVFAACNKGEEPGETDGSDTTASEKKNDENELPADAWTAETEGVIDLTDYKIIRPKTFDSDGTKATATFANYLKEYCGLNLMTKQDATFQDSGKEILIGLTNRQASKDANKTIKSKDWSVSVNGDKIVILAGSETSIVNATNWIVQNALQKNNKYAKIGDGFTYKHEYVVSDLKMGDKVINDVNVAFLSQDNVGFVDAGLLLVDNLSSLTGIKTSYVNNVTAEGFKILVAGSYMAKALNIMPNGLTVGTRQYAITKVGDNIMIIADDAIGAEIAAQKILRAILGANKQALDLATLCSDTAVTYDYKADALDLTVGAEYRIMSYNVERVDSSLAGNTSDRYDEMTNAVKFYNPDVVGFQEYCVNYKANANPILEAAGYTFVNPTPEKYSEQDNACSNGESPYTGGVYDINHNYTPIAYKTDKFNLVASGAQRIIPCRANEEGVYKNTIQKNYGWPGYTITWAVLEDKTTHDKFAVTSLHNLTGSDPTADQASVTAREENLKTIVKPLIEKIATDYACSVFMTGDYNSRLTNADIAKSLLGDKTIVDTRDAAVRGYSHGSSSGSRGVLIARTTGNPIDHIFMKGEATVVRHRYALSQITSDAADHRPVMIDVVV